MLNRIMRISEEMKKEIFDLMQNDLKDPRLPKIASILSIDLAKDLRYARIYVSVLGTDKEKNDAIEALKSASGFIRRELGQRMQIRRIPELQFELDGSIERGVYITSLINRVMNESGKR